MKKKAYRYTIHFSNGQDVTVSAPDLDAAEKLAARKMAGVKPQAVIRCTLDLACAAGLRQLDRSIRSLAN